MAKKLKQLRACARPDRDEPRIVCGYPLPCPHHTAVVELKSGAVMAPRASPAQAARLRSVARALRSTPAQKEARDGR